MLKPARPDGKLEVLTEGFTAACDPCLSFDGTKLLFAAKKTPDADWNIWEMKINGKNKRQITSNLGDCRQPAYLAKSSITPPEFSDRVRWIVFTSTAPGTYDESGDEIATALYVCNIEPIDGRGTVIWRTTFNLSHDFSPAVLSDGRVLFSSWQHHGNRYYPHGLVALMTCNWAGTGLNLFYGNHQGAPVKSMACEMPDRTIVFVQSEGRTTDGSGTLARVSLRRPLHSHETLSRDRGRYLTPHPFPNGKLAVAYTSQHKENYGIYLFDFQQGEPGGVIYDDPRWHELDGVAVVPRPEPQGRITIVDDSKSTGHIQCLNVYDSDRPEAKDITPGQVKWVRLIEGIPLTQKDRESLKFISGIGQSGPGSTTNGATAYEQTRIIGEAPVEEDGSFYLEVPADTPISFQILDENRMALQTMRGWVWVRRGSRRGCIGCHENRELAPENRATLALLKAEPTRLVTPPEERRTVDFRRDVGPVIETECAGCHSGPAPPGGLELSSQKVTHEGGSFFSRAYENLMQPLPGKPLEIGGKYVHPGSARSSPLIWLIFSQGTGADYGDASHDNPIGQKHPHIPLSADEKRSFVEWIDLGAQWDNLPGEDEF
ncbi:MAG: hypothetical protein ACE5OR_02360 [bacterium]